MPRVPDENPCISINSLREEIIESQRAKTSFLRWKLILIAVLGATGLGLSGLSSGAGSANLFPFVIGLIPFGCVYVDALCVHNDLRIVVLGRYLRDGHSTPDGIALEPPDAHIAAYERLCDEERSSYALESFALFGVTVLASVVVGVAGFPVVRDIMFPQIPQAAKGALSGCLIVAAEVGILMSLVSFSYRQSVTARQKRRYCDPRGPGTPEPARPEPEVADRGPGRGDDRDGERDDAPALTFNLRIGLPWRIRIARRRHD